MDTGAEDSGDLVPPQTQPNATPERTPFSPSALHPVTRVAGNRALRCGIRGGPAVSDLLPALSLMDRSLLVAGILLCLPACLPSPNTPAPIVVPVTGEWTGTFESSWGLLPVRATLRNERGTQSISGEFRIDGQRASGTVRGLLETRDRYSGTSFWGSLMISYVTASGEMCRSERVFPSGTARTLPQPCASASVVSGHNGVAHRN